MPGYAVEIRDAQNRPLAGAVDRPGVHQWPEPDVGLLSQRRRDPRCAPGQWLARHRRPRLPGRRPAGDHRPQQGPDHRRRPQHLAAGPRVGGRASRRRARRRRGRVRRQPRRRQRAGGRRRAVPGREQPQRRSISARSSRSGTPCGRGRVRGGAGTAAVADLHDVGQAEPGRGQGRLSERCHPRRRSLPVEPVGSSSSASPSPAEPDRVHATHRGMPPTSPLPVPPDSSADTWR